MADQSPSAELRQAAPAISEASTLSGYISEQAFRSFTEKWHYTYAGVAYDVEDGGGDDPLVLVRKDDGRRFEVELEATVTELTAGELARRAELHDRLQGAVRAHLGETP